MDNKKKLSMEHLIEKILRMPESNIKGFLRISGTAYLEDNKKEIIRAYNEDLYGGLNGHRKFENGVEYFEETYEN